MTKKRVGIVVLVMAVVLIVGMFAFVAYRTPKSAEDATRITEKDELMHKNIAADYPKTPREVLKLYNRYILLLYGSQGEELNDQEIQTLGQQMRELYDEELKSLNPEDTQQLSLMQELSAFRKDKKVMIQTNVCSSNEVEYIDIKGDSGASAQVSYFVKEGNKEFTRTYQKFLLRKDEQGEWKILGFAKVDGGED